MVEQPMTKEQGPVAVERAKGQLATNAGFRMEIKRDILDRFLGHGSNPRMRWFLEDGDGQYLGWDGKVYTAAQLEGRTLTTILIQEV